MQQHFTDAEVQSVREIIETAVAVHPSLKGYLVGIDTDEMLYSTDVENDTLLLGGYTITRTLDSRDTIAGPVPEIKHVVHAEVGPCYEEGAFAGGDIELGVYNSLTDAVLAALSHEFIASIENLLAANGEARAIEEMERMYEQMQHARALEDFSRT